MSPLILEPFITFSSLFQRHHHSFQSIKAVDQTLSRVWHRFTVCLLGVGSDNSLNENQLTGGLGKGIFTKAVQFDCHTDRLSQTILGNNKQLHHNTDLNWSITWHMIFGSLRAKTNHVMVFMTSMCLFETLVLWTRQWMLLQFACNCLRVNCLGSFKELFLKNQAGIHEVASRIWKE